MPTHTKPAGIHGLLPCLMAGILLLSLNLPFTSDAASYFVSTAGNDSNNGTSSPTAWRTIQHAANSVAPGDTVTVGAGTFYERVTLQVSAAAGNYITIQGTLDGGGNQLTTIDGSDALTGWTADTATCGDGCYRATPPYKTYWLGESVSGDSQDIFRMPTANYLDVPTTGIWTAADNYFSNTAVAYWDGYEALWMGTGTFENLYMDGASPGSVWVRYKNKENPNSKSMRVSNSAGVIDTNGKAHTAIKDFKIQGGRWGVRINGGNNIQLEHNHIINGGKIVIFENSPHDIVILNNTIHRNGITSSYLPGAWTHYNPDPISPAAGTPDYIAGVNEKFYRVFKANGSDLYGYGIWMVVGGTMSNIQISGNTIYDLGGVGIGWSHVTNMQIFQNTFHNIAAVGVMPYLDYSGVIIYNNLLYNNDIHLRFLGIGESPSTPKQSWFYKNRAWNPPHKGTHIYWHWDADGIAPGSHEQYIYHNSFTGGDQGFSTSQYGTQGLTNTRVINNIMSSDIWASTPQPIATFAYNWLVGSTPSSVPGSWVGTNNTLTVSATMFWTPADAVPDFLLTAGNAARQTAKNVSTTFSLGSWNSAALPGMSPGYFSGSFPDPGALQYGVSGGSSPLPAPVNLRASSVIFGPVDTVNLAWDFTVVDTLVGYNLYRRSPCTGSYTLLNTGIIAPPALSYADTTVQPGSTVCWVVRTLDTLDAESANSSEVSYVAPAYVVGSIGLSVTVR